MPKRSKSLLQKALVVLHITAGIYAGACLSIAIVDLRFLLSISNSDVILEVFSPMLGNMGKLMVPQLVILFILCLTFSMKAIQLKRSLISHVPLVIYLGILGITLAVHIPINLDAFAGEIPLEELTETVALWDTWHWVRTVLSLLLPGSIFKFYRPLILAGASRATH